jgi:putative hemolysin
VSGFVRSTDVLPPLLRGERVDLRRIAVPPLFVPPTMTVMRLLEQFRRAHVPVALVIDEHGAVEGLISLADVVAAIVGEVSSPDGDPMIVERPDGSWLLDGALDLAEVRRLLRDDDFAQDAAGYYHTLGGLTMYALGRIPRTGDTFEKEGVAFEVIDMDGNRVDKILARRIVASSTDAS